MVLEEVLKFFGSYRKFSNITKMSTSNIVNWRKRGYIPFKTQKKLEKISNGALQAEWKD